ncbi:rod shape-determining protein MreD [Sporolactobacillus kofuensis]|uniref:Rod shape-determining protein MreD n=1 Tax=Sporolactobacillus kofuensis TaxID=269672 RepID=A0ABW1W9B0_9BACL|nr:rod shape-determining protein MreD [Sporolactobacillus kofuensis]MCO7175582.1 rod shape-determining protein MreD [Sporolactobacillus kofuensis]
MKQIKVFIFLFILFLIQGTVMPLIPMNGLWKNLQFIPDFVLVALLMIAFFGSLSWGLKYAMVFGFLIDLTYSTVLGVYAFCLVLTVYCVYTISRWVNMNTAMTLLLSAVGVCFMQLGVYVIYLMIGLTDQTFVDFIQLRLLPTVVLNALFAAIIYLPFRRYLEKITNGPEN